MRAPRVEPGREGVTTAVRVPEPVRQPPRAGQLPCACPHHCPPLTPSVATIRRVRCAVRLAHSLSSRSRLLNTNASIAGPSHSRAARPRGEATVTVASRARSSAPRSPAVKYAPSAPRSRSHGSSSAPRGSRRSPIVTIVRSPPGSSRVSARRVGSSRPSRVDPDATLGELRRRGLSVARSRPSAQKKVHLSAQLRQHHRHHPAASRRAGERTLSVHHLARLREALHRHELHPTRHARPPPPASSHAELPGEDAGGHEIARWRVKACTPRCWHGLP